MIVDSYYEPPPPSELEKLQEQVSDLTNLVQRLCDILHNAGLITKQTLK